MTLHQHLNTNRQRLGIPDPELLGQVVLEPERVAELLKRTIALIDAVDLLTTQSLTVELEATKQLATAVEAAIAEAVLTAQ